MNIFALLYLALWTLAGLKTSASSSEFKECSLPHAAKSNWLPVNNQTTYYHLAPTIKVDFYCAYDYCKQQNGSILSIHSDEETKTIWDLIKRTGKQYMILDIWLGLRRDVNSGVKERWSDGSVLDYVNWNNTGDEPETNCAYVRATGRGNERGRWFHANCADKMYVMCKKTAVEVPQPLPSVVGECEEGWIRHMNNCYWINSKALTFDTASKECQAKFRSDLASIHSDQQQNFINALLGSAGSDAYWLGGYRAVWHQYMWRSNLRFNYDNWLPDHPSYGNKDQKYCIKTVLDTPYGAGKWEDVDCSQKLPSICQKLPNPKLTVPSTSTFPPTCPKNSNYYLYKNACFKVYDQPRAWRDAQGVCQNDGGNLISFADRLEYATFKEIVRGRSTRDVWLGMSGVKHDSETFQWNDSTPLYFTNWDQIPVAEENSTQCVYQKSSGLWSATSECTSLKAFACKIHINGQPVAKISSQKKCPTTGSSSRRWVDLDSSLDRCYSLSSTPDTFGNAQFQCRLQGGHLVSIHSEHERKLLEDYANRGGSSEPRPDFWLGMHRTYAGSFQWMDNSAVNFVSWKDGGPDVEAYDQCVASSVPLKSWETRACYSNFLYICSAQKVSGEPLNQKPSESNILVTASTILMVLIFASAVIVIGFYAFRFYAERREFGSNIGLGVAYAKAA